MDCFSSFMLVLNYHSSALEEEASQVDIVGRLPPEIASRILRLLDGPSLVAAAGVSQCWKARCRADPVLRRRVRRQLFYEGRGALFALQETARPIMRPARPESTPSRVHHANANAHAYAFARVNARERQLDLAAAPDRTRAVESERMFALCGPTRPSACLPAFPSRLRETGERRPCKRRRTVAQPPAKPKKNSAFLKRISAKQNFSS